jgi:hypothetical protein
MTPFFALRAVANTSYPGRIGVEAGEDDVEGTVVLGFPGRKWRKSGCVHWKRMMTDEGPKAVRVSVVGTLADSV